MNNIKAQLHEYCTRYIDERILHAQQAIRSAQESANDDTKSSAGDKYETGRAMMQQEIEKHTVQLAEAQRLKQVLRQIHPSKVYSRIQAGSLVQTSQGSFYLAISIGRHVIADQAVFIISTASPIGALLLGKQAGDQFSFNGNVFMISDVA